ncbi:hypothetical protein CAEBREN_16649 [Caenorhabditis brenneri]|uniref:Uncharacterized protein n=1 Tax=Caenorhabditis brenneri TaxID=135651 RepID=G0NLA0_CAEBE|nr:hypothetical protein CAEBREN_16649 [Caenorhabditis brenneri]
MKRVRTRAPLTILTKCDRIQVVQVMEDMLNVVESASEEKNDPKILYDDKTEVRKVMSYLLDQVVHIKPKRIRKPRIKNLPSEVFIQEHPIAEEDPPFVPKTLEEIQRDRWDFNDFVVSLPLLVSKEEIHKEVLKANVYSKERTHNFNRQTDITSPDYNPVFQPLPFFGLEDPSQLLWQQMFGMTPGPFFSHQSSTSSSLFSSSQVLDNQLQGERQKTEESSPRKRARPKSKVVGIHDSYAPATAAPPTLPHGEGPCSQIMTPENVVSE